MDLETSNISDGADFKVGDWWVRPQSNSLERAGDSVQLEARSIAVLVCLARHAPDVVSKERLLEEVWGDSPYVGDDVISHAVWELRKAFGDSARDPAYIRTVPRKGYRLVAEVLRPEGAPLPMEGVRIDHYDLGEELGRGAMGVVYKAVDRRLDRTVAVKFLASELTRDLKACQRFQREARLAASLEHPNLATVHEVGETSRGYRYLVSAYYRGGSLKDRLAAGPVALDEAQRWMRQLVAGLGAAHQRDIIHRDVKPANLLLDEHGTLKICDFGIAKLLGSTDLTRTGAPLGTPAYKSPEQSRGRDVDHRTDLWSAGVVFYELLTGRRPFEASFEHAVVHSILSDEPPELNDARGRPLPELVRRFVGRALAKDPAERFQSAEEMAAALEDLDEAPSTSRRRPAAGVLLAVAPALLVLLWVGSEMGSGPLKTTPPEPLPVEPEPESGEMPTEVRDHLHEGRKQWPRGNHQANLRAVREHFEAAVKISPNAETRVHLAAFLAESAAFYSNPDDRESARELAREALKEDPKSALAWATLSWILLQENKPEEGEQLARKALRLEPSCDRGRLCDLAYVWLGDALWMQGREDEAFDFLEECLQHGDGRIRCRLKMAQLHEKSGRYREAKEAYRKVLDQDRTQTTALQDLGILLATTNDPMEAIDLFDRLYRTTQHPSALVNKGYALYMHGGTLALSQAIETYRQADKEYRELGGQSPTPLVGIGDAYLEMGDQKAALGAYRQALDIFDSLPELNIPRQGQRAVCLAKIGFLDSDPSLLDEARTDIEHLLEERSDVPELVVYAGRIYALREDDDELFNMARRWIELGKKPYRFLDDDPVFIPYRDNLEYLRILKPQVYGTD